VGGIVASEASRKNFDIPNNIIKRLIGKKITFVTFGGAMAPLAPPWIRHCLQFFIAWYAQLSLPDTGKV
jgi:hypothetical protein